MKRFYEKKKKIVKKALSQTFDRVLDTLLKLQSSQSILWLHWLFFLPNKKSAPFTKTNNSSRVEYF